MPTKKTVKPNTPCKTCWNRDWDLEDDVPYCELSGKEIADETTYIDEEFEDENDYCVNHTKNGPVGPQMPG